MSAQQMVEQIEHLTPEARHEAEVFIQSLGKRESQEVKLPTFSWEGGLEYLKDEFTSVQLQKKALEWM